MKQVLRLLPAAVLAILASGTTTAIHADATGGYPRDLHEEFIEVPVSAGLAEMFENQRPWQAAPATRVAAGGQVLARDVHLTMTDVAGVLSISRRTVDKASSTRSIALSGRLRSLM